VSTFTAGVEAAAEFAGLTPSGATPAQTALRWIIQQPGVTTVIPGARNPDQVRANASAASLAPLRECTLAAVRELHDRRLRAAIHPHW
jgi:aryl-alcohol dehydrogenase-like predicted oxidoreductase